MRHYHVAFVGNAKPSEKDLIGQLDLETYGEVISVRFVDVQRAHWITLISLEQVDKAVQQMPFQMGFGAYAVIETEDGYEPDKHGNPDRQRPLKGYHGK